MTRRPWRAGSSWRYCWHPVFGMRDNLSHDGHPELMLGGDPLLDALIDFSHRGRRRSIELTLTRLRLRLQALPALKRVLFLRRYAKLEVDTLSASHKLSTIKHCNHLTYSPHPRAEDILPPLPDSCEHDPLSAPAPVDWPSFYR